MRLSTALSPAPWLACLKSTQLQRIARATGIQSSGTKGVLIERIATEITTQSQSHHSDRSPSRSGHDQRKGQSGSENLASGHETDMADSKPWSILSIDMGIQNLAFAHLIVPRSGDPPRPVLRAWHRLAVSEISSLDLVCPGKTVGQSVHGSGDVTGLSDGVVPFTKLVGDQAVASRAKEKESFSPDVYAANAYTLISSLLTAYRPTHVLIERQRFRSGGGSAVQEWSLRVGVLEGMLHAVLHTLRRERGGEIADLVVRGVEPKRVVGYWLEHGRSPVEEETEQTGKGKRPNAKEVKKAKIDLVGEWLAAAGQDVDALPEMVHGSRQRVSGSAGGNIALAEKSECPVLHGVVDAYMRKWQHKRKTLKEGKAKKVADGEGTPALSPSSQSMQDEVIPINLGKLDDLADCLLQGVTWIEWQNMRERIAREGIEALDSRSS